MPQSDIAALPWVTHLTLQDVATPIAVTGYTVSEHGVLMAGEEPPNHRGFGG